MIRVSIASSFCFCAFVAVAPQPILAQWDDSKTRTDAVSTDDAKNDTGNTLGEAASESQPSLHAPTAKDSRNPLTEGQRELLVQRVNSGQSTYQVGRVMAWGGLAVSVIGNFARVPALNTLGGLATGIGIPVMGVGAGRAEKGSLELNPHGEPANRTGWPVYWTGWGLQGAGILFIIGGIAGNIEEDEYGNEELGDGAAAPIILGVISLISGAICHYVAWYQFSERLDQSKLNMAGIALVPKLHMHDGRIDGGGLSLALDF